MIDFNSENVPQFALLKRNKEKTQCAGHSDKRHCSENTERKSRETCAGTSSEKGSWLKLWCGGWCRKIRGSGFWIVVMCLFWCLCSSGSDWSKLATAVKSSIICILSSSFHFHIFLPSFTQFGSCFIDGELYSLNKIFEVSVPKLNSLKQPRMFTLCVYLDRVLFEILFEIIIIILCVI